MSPIVVARSPALSRASGARGGGGGGGGDDENGSDSQMFCYLILFSSAPAAAPLTRASTSSSDEGSGFPCVIHTRYIFGRTVLEEATTGAAARRHRQSNVASRPQFLCQWTNRQPREPRSLSEHSLSLSLSSAQGGPLRLDSEMQLMFFS